MNFRMMMTAGLMLALAGCTTTAALPTITSNPVSDRWEGQSAGRFFAAFGPPIADRDEGGNRVYTWRGGYKTVTVGAKDADGAKKGKAGGRKRFLSCKADIVTSDSYVIRSIHILADQPGVNGSSYCAELLAPAEKS